jgi:hypothetical protein
MKLIKDAEKKQVEESQTNEPGTRENERANHPEEPGALSKPALRPVNMETLTEAESHEEEN